MEDKFNWANWLALKIVHLSVMRNISWKLRQTYPISLKIVVVYVMHFYQEGYLIIKFVITEG